MPARFGYKDPMSIDLHAHTTHSDGLLSPERLLALARSHGVRTFAVTDHDTVSGLAPSARAAGLEGLSFVPGIEVTAGFNGREIHVLGHFIVPTEPELVAFCESMRTERQRRTVRMLDSLEKAGVSLSMDEVLAQSSGQTLGRPHIARAMVAKGIVEHMQEAFDRYLTPGRPGWVERERPEAAEAIALIHRAGGTASVAHPGADRIGKQELRALANDGLDAVEAFHPGHPPSQSEAFVRWGAEFGLLATGGSDFHGPESEMSRPGLVSAPTKDVERLRMRATTRQAHLKEAVAAWRKSIDSGSGS